MKRIRSIVIVSCTVIFSLGGVAAEDTYVDRLCGELTAVMDAISDHHIDPPTRQQMILDSLRKAAALRKQQLPLNLAAEISATPPDELNAFLKTQLVALYAPAVTTPLGGNTFGQSFLSDVGYLQPIQIRMVPREADRVQKQLAANRYVGIGIRLGMHKTDGPFMQKVFADGPAELAGAKDQDRILEIDGRSTKGVSVNQTVERLRGAEGTDVEVVLQSMGESTSRTYTITRGVVPIQGVTPLVYSEDRRAVGMRIEQVTASTVHELRKRESELDPAVPFVVLDVRNLNDSDLHHGKLLANALIDERPVGIIETRSGRETFTAEPGRLFQDRQLVLLIGARTGGTVEWIAAAIQDQEQGILLGSATRGNGYCIESVAPENMNMLLQMPVSRLLRIGGQSLTSSALRTQHTMQLVPVAPFSEENRPGVVRRVSKNGQNGGPGVSSDVTNVLWPNFGGDEKPEIELQAAVDMVLEILDAEKPTPANVIGDEGR